VAWLINAKTDLYLASQHLDSYSAGFECVDISLHKASLRMMIVRMGLKSFWFDRTDWGCSWGILWIVEADDYGKEEDASKALHGSRLPNTHQFVVQHVPITRSQNLIGVT
jgi:hypothetical protein